MKILAIETSCDETSIAIVECSGGLKNPRFKVLKNIVSSQIEAHRPFGGVVPMLAKREHIHNLPQVLKTLVASGYTLNPDLIAVTVGPGLEPALWAGIEYAKELAKKLKKPLIGANHMEGHLYSNWLPVTKIENLKFKIKNSLPRFPAIALVVSGGHTILLKMDSLTKWKKLGETRDDAAGEAYDKVARMLELPYPGGPEIERLAKKGDAAAIKFPRPMLREKNYDFSFSGLKTAVLYYLRDKGQRRSASSLRKSAGAADVAASFQQAVFDVLIGKTIRAARECGAKSVLLCGGVSANKTLQKELGSRVEGLGLDFHVPEREFNTDNAAMIAAAAYLQHLRKKKLPLKANSNLNL